MLTDAQKAIITATVPVLKENGVALTKHFYNRMLTNNPELRQIFSMTHQRTGHQAGALASAVLAYAQNIDNLAVLEQAVTHIAHKHVSVGIRAEHYPIVGHHLIESIREVLGEAATPDIIDAWSAAYAQLADVFINAEAQLYKDATLAPGGLVGLALVRDHGKASRNGGCGELHLKAGGQWSCNRCGSGAVSLGSRVH